MGRVERDTKMRGRPQFWSLIERGDPTACWLWRGPTQTKRPTIPNAVSLEGNVRQPTYHVYMHEYGSVPADTMLLHRCGNSLCCNPEHLYARPVSSTRTHCPRGHLLTDENTKMRGGTRVCLSCNRLRSAAGHARAAALKAARSTTYRLTYAGGLREVLTSWAALQARVGELRDQHGHTVIVEREVNGEFVRWKAPNRPNPKKTKGTVSL